MDFGRFYVLGRMGCETHFLQIVLNPRPFQILIPLQILISFDYALTNWISVLSSSMFNRYKQRVKANMKFKVIGKEQSSVLKTTFSLFLLTSIRVFNLRSLVYKQGIREKRNHSIGHQSIKPYEPWGGSAIALGK